MLGKKGEIAEKVKKEEGKNSKEGEKCIQDLREKVIKGIKGDREIKKCQ